MSRAFHRIGVGAIVVLLAGCGSSTPTTSPPAAPPSAVAPSATSELTPTPAASATPAAPPSPGASAVINPADFSATVDNPWFPLVPGTTLTYKGQKDDKPSIDTFEITRETAVIDGVTCVVIHDTLTQGGKVAEQTVDWYAQDSAGNVWYFGEDTKTLDANGKVTSTDGTWQAGVDGAQPGIFMPAQPAIGQSFQQEFASDAQDHFVILQIGVPVKVPFGAFPDGMTTAEWTPLEPDVLSEKAYVKGTGEVKEFDVAGSNEGFQLVNVTKQ
ncbi:MAG TPA: hypothetical protein VGK16_13875 [Candidatus Limnocylindrales bacterium]|jgi:hypothetical protein